MTVHVVDGTYELFRQFYGLRRFRVKGIASRGFEDRPYGAVVGVLNGVLAMIEQGDPIKGSASRGPTYIGVATDHVIESFRNKLWAGYKTGGGIERALLAQFHPLEEALAAMGVVLDGYWHIIDRQRSAENFRPDRRYSKARQQSWRGRQGCRGSRRRHRPRGRAGPG
jgi:hypothetical protein